MYLIVGLGNIGKQYQNTRHNLGFIFADKIVSEFSFSNVVTDKKLDSDLYFGEIGENKVILSKPRTFMNLSGSAVYKIASYYKISPDRILVIHDDIDLDLAQVKVKIGGGNAGHNGLKSLEEYIGKHFARIRIGVGRPNIIETPNLNVADFVLGSFTTQERLKIDQSLDNLLTKTEELFLTIKDNSPIDLNCLNQLTFKTNNQ